MKGFMDENFLLETPTAVTLYHNYAKDMPLFDYHCHLSPKEIAEDKRYRNITEVWLGGDHYKWRAMRSNGVEEKYVTGEGSDKEKFLAWAATMPYALGNPLYHWSHLELKRFFDVDEVLSPATAEIIWDKCNAKLKEDGFSARGLIARSNVKALCTTDDPVDSLEYHKIIAADKSFKTKVLPTFRPDKAVNIDKPGFLEWIGALEKAASIKINSFGDLTKALAQRLEFFHENGCRLSDHGLDSSVYAPGTDEDASKILADALAGKAPTAQEATLYKTRLLIFFGREYSRLGWVMQLHIAALRNNSSRMFKKLGPDTGFDSIGDPPCAEALVKFFDALDTTDSVPKTILYSLNAYDNEVLATIMGSFQGGGIPGKIQLGSAWWFNDQKDGMEKQMIALANLGLLGRFVGMLTDSRSFISYTRHEYFRRILCNILGKWADNGEVPNNPELLGGMVKDISYNNAKAYFGVTLD